MLVILASVLDILPGIIVISIDNNAVELFITNKKVHELCISKLDTLAFHVIQVF